MCETCGCGLPSGVPVTVSSHDHHDPGDHDHHHHDHDHDDHSHHHHSHEPGAEERQTLDLRRAILEKNDRLAERNRH